MATNGLPDGPRGDGQNDHEAMDEYLPFAELREVSPMFREYERQVEERGEVGLVFSLTELWKAAGRPWRKSPRHFARRVQEIRSYRIEDRGGRDGDVLADVQTAFSYCYDVDRRIKTACFRRELIRIQKRREYPQWAVNEAVNNPNPSSVMFATVGLHEQGLDADQSRRRFLDAAKEKAAAMDVYAGETLVARVHRVVDAWKFIPDDPSSGTPERFFLADPSSDTPDKFISDYPWSGTPDSFIPADPSSGTPVPEAS